MATSSLIRLAQITALVAFLVVLFYKSYEFSGGPQIGSQFSEPFENTPTRAADCRCLPGYVASNTKKSGELVLDPRGWGYLLEGSKKYGFWWNMHELGFWWWNTKYRWVSTEEISKYSDGGNASKQQIQDALANQGKDIESAVYFCQSLSDPSKTRQCY